jgi:hypothetical protein
VVRGQEFRWRDRELECLGEPASSSGWHVYNTVVKRRAGVDRAATPFALLTHCISNGKLAPCPRSAGRNLQPSPVLVRPRTGSAAMEAAQRIRVRSRPVISSMRLACATGRRKLSRLQPLSVGAAPQYVAVGISGNEDQLAARRAYGQNHAPGIQ